MPGARVLVVDDDRDVREGIAAVLTDAGYRVCVAKDGLQALEMLDLAVPDLVLLNLVMPRMSGEAFIKNVRSRVAPRTFCVVAMSGRLDSRSSPTKWFLAKPLRRGLLLTVVRELCPPDGGSISTQSPATRVNGVSCRDG